MDQPERQPLERSDRQSMGTPPVSDMDAVRLVDVLGSGYQRRPVERGCQWPLSRDHFFFLDFTGGLKPYLLHEMDNHMGAVTKVDYAPSTRFYLEDQKRPETRWKTTLAVPVHVVARVEVIDQFSQGQAHHRIPLSPRLLGRRRARVPRLRHGGAARYRVVRRVRQQRVTWRRGAVSRKVDRQYFSPPTLTKTWFHQGPVGDEFGDWQELD